MGLWPYNPEKILEICKKHCPVDSRDEENEAMRDLIDAINIQRKRQDDKRDKILSELDPATVTESEDYDFQIFRDEEDEEYMVDEGDEGDSSPSEDIEDTSVEPPAKRRRTSSAKRKTCCARGCQKSHIRSKKWLVCPMCKKNFCPSHAALFQHHKC